MRLGAQHLSYYTKKDLLALETPSFTVFVWLFSGLLYFPGRDESALFVGNTVNKSDYASSLASLFCWFTIREIRNKGGKYQPACCCLRTFFFPFLQTHGCIFFSHWASKCFLESLVCTRHCAKPSADASCSLNPLCLQHSPRESHAICKIFSEKSFSATGKANYFLYPFRCSF